MMTNMQESERWSRWDHRNGKRYYDSPTGAPVSRKEEYPVCPHSPAMLRVLVAEALKEPRYVRRKAASYLVVDGKLVHDGQGDFIRVPAPPKPKQPKAEPVVTYEWIGRECRFPHRYTDGGRFTVPHRKAPAANDNVPTVPRWRVARPVGKMREALPIVTALRDATNKLYRADIDMPREALVYVAQALADDFGVAAMPAGYVPTNHCSHTREPLPEGFKLLQAKAENGEYEGKAVKARSETYAWQPAPVSPAVNDRRMTTIAGEWSDDEAIWTDVESHTAEETTRHVSYGDDGKARVEMRDWFITTSRTVRINADGVSVWRRVVRAPAVDAEGNPKHDGKPSNELRFIRKETAPADKETEHDLSGADARIESVQRLELIRRVLSRNAFRMLRAACFEGLTLKEIGERFGFGADDKRSVAEVRGILREALFRSAEVYAKLAAIERSDDIMTAGDWADLGNVNRMIASNDNAERRAAA